MRMPRLRRSVARDLSAQTIEFALQQSAGVLTVGDAVSLTKNAQGTANEASRGFGTLGAPREQGFVRP